MACIPTWGILVERQTRVRSHRRRFLCWVDTWPTHTRLCVILATSGGWVYQENASAIQTIPILHCRNWALPSAAAETRRKRFRSPPPPPWARPHVPTWESPGAETHPAQQTFCFSSFYMEFITNGYSSPQSSPHPSFGLFSRELKYLFDLMEDWHQRKPSVTQDFSQSLVLKSMY